MVRCVTGFRTACATDLFVELELQREAIAMDDLVKVRVHAPSGTIILQRPDKRNAMSRLMMLQMQQAFEDLHLERRVRAVIVTGAGTAFCSGVDLSEVHATLGTEDALEQWQRDTLQLKQLYQTMLEFPKPIVAAVNGLALGAGAGLVLASDIVLGTPDAQFGLPEPRRGLVAGLVSVLLAFRVGSGLAANLLLSARNIDAQEAYQRGIYHRIVPFDQAWAAAHEQSNQCAQSSPEAIQLTKRMLNETIGEHLGTLLSAGAAVAATAHTTPAAEEGLTAFVEKRDPTWK